MGDGKNGGMSQFQISGFEFQFQNPSQPLMVKRLAMLRTKLETGN
jgi:hypothetical protein